MRTNSKPIKKTTYEGGPSERNSPDQLERLVSTCMLFEGTFYETGDEQAQNIRAECVAATADRIATMAVYAREMLNLRHVPLFLLVQLDKKRASLPADSELIKNTVAKVIKRPDECGELLSLLSKEHSKPIKKCMSHAVQKGIALAFSRFNEYQLAKWNRDSDITLKDVMFLTHPKPSQNGQCETLTREYANGYGKVKRHRGSVLGKLALGSLETPVTWETQLSSGQDKKYTWEYLLTSGNLGYMALLMNLRNMYEAGVSKKLVERALRDGAGRSKALPFRFVSAVSHAPEYADAISDAMVSALSGSRGKLKGHTAILVDRSGSMESLLSGKSTMNRAMAAASMAIMAKEICEVVSVYGFNTTLSKIKGSRGLQMISEIGAPVGGTRLGNSLRELMDSPEYEDIDRVIVITDEQSRDAIPAIKGKTGWIINVAGYSSALRLELGWSRMSGFSERIFDYICVEENVSITEECEE